MSNERFYYVLSGAHFLICVLQVLDRSAWAIPSLLLSVAFLERAISRTGARRKKTTEKG